MAETSRSRPAAPRSLADDLRTRSDDELVDLLRRRGDLAVPVPADVASLAVRATTRASVQRALDRMDAPTLQVVEVLAVLPEPVTPAAVSRAWGADATELLDGLRRSALVWGPGRALRLVRVARDVLGPYPAGLGPPLREALDRRSPARLTELARTLGLPEVGAPEAAVAAVAAHLGTRRTVEALLESAPEGAAAVLAALTWDSPVGEVQSAHPGADVSGRGPVAWLLRHGLLAVIEPGRVVCPREVGLALRRGRVHREPALSPPSPRGREVSRRSVDDAAAGSAAEAVRLVAALLDTAGATTLAVLRAGGLGVRDLRRVAAQLQVDELDAARVTELAFAAGLLDDDAEERPSWSPTGASDAWLELGTAERWGLLALAWSASTGVPALVGTKDPAGGVRAALSEAVRRPSAPVLRAELLRELAELPEGLAPDTGSVLERLAHRSPRRGGSGRDELARRLLEDAAWLGVTGLGALSGHGRRLVGSTTGADGAVAALAALLPEPVDHLLVQADLTAVAPGPLVPELAREVDLAADVESRGAATVYRFSADSVRRALDAGRTADDLLAMLDTASPTGVPQPLEYLVRDVARRHGLVRVGQAGAFLRAEDPAALSELLVDRRLAQLGLRRLAPTVVAASADPTTVLDRLRAVGLAPALESADGTVVVGAHPARRAPVRRRPPVRPATPATPSVADLAQAVARWRLAEAGPRPGSVELPHLAPRASLRVLQAAVSDGRRVWVGYVDETGRTTRRLLEPQGLEGGRLTATEVGRPGSRSFSVHRVTGAVPAAEVPD